MIFTPDTGASTSFTSNYTLSASGTVKSVTIGDGRPRTVTFTNDLAGQVIRRDESDNNAGQGDPHTVNYRFAGRDIATTSNVTQSSAYTYEDSIAKRIEKPAVTSGSSYVFQGGGGAKGNLSYDRVISFRQGSAAGAYTVRAGDTLAGIAQSLWGDSAL